ncbi:alpha/beta hydrolase family protein [Kocuria sp.]|uniref:alpha/beta hydrolase family protein n=1 Tax=Kocuria sp. TaxID=1871328 RepID=UPI0026DEBB52|nr:alpha/beta hydrolase [Kocuria sp.]MDO5619021.1 alpha/beta hydrolase [Kocuria sp.]
MKPLPRRALFTAGALGVLAGAGLASSSVVGTGAAQAMVVAGRTRAGTPSETKIQWGADPQRQTGQLFLPDPQHFGGGEGTTSYPVIMFIHGGGWTDKSGPLYCQAAAQDLARYGVAVWLPTYRGTPWPGGWPMTFQDVSDALDHVARLGEYADFQPDLTRVHLTGHSAGGHLAAWVAGRDQLPADMPGGRNTSSGDPHAVRVTVQSTTPLAGVLDFEKAVYEDNDNWVVDVMGGRPEEEPQRYKALSPIEQLPLNIPVNVLHGKADATVPVATLRDYISKHAQTGNTGRVVLLDGVEHNDFVDIHHHAWTVAREVCLASVGKPYAV